MASACSGGDVIKEKVILCLGGAFNPVHTRHVQAMVLGKEWLEANTNFEVIAGRLAVATDGYVKAKTNKTGAKCMKAVHRIKLCELACYKYSDWLLPYHRPAGSAAECGEKTQTELSKLTGNNNIKIAVIVGSDRSMNKSGHAKWHKEYSHITLSIGRKGETSRIMDKFKEDKDLGKVKHNNFYLVPEELDDVSSTLVRQNLARMDEQGADKDSIIDSLVNDGLICTSMGEYILKKETDLYL